MGVTAVGKEMERTPKYFLLATRILAELGASIIKTYYCEDFEKVVAACPDDSLKLKESLISKLSVLVNLKSSKNAGVLG